MPAPSRGCPWGLIHRDPLGMCGALRGVLSPDVGQWVVGSGRSSPDAGTTVCPTQKMEELPLPPDGAAGDPRSLGVVWCTPSSVRLWM